MSRPPPRSTLFPYTTLFRSATRVWPTPMNWRAQSSPGCFNSSTGAASKSDRKSTRLNSSHGYISYAVFCLKKKIIEVDGERLHYIEEDSSSSVVLLHVFAGH